MRRFACSTVVGLVGIVMEVLVLRRIYRAAGLFQIVATFAVILIVQDLVQTIWGPDEIFSPRAPGLRGAVEIAAEIHVNCTGESNPGPPRNRPGGLSRPVF